MASITFRSYAFGWELTIHGRLDASHDQNIRDATRSLNEAADLNQIFIDLSDATIDDCNALQAIYEFVSAQRRHSRTVTVTCSPQVKLVALQELGVGSPLFSAMFAT